jgi:3-hydroxyacyl-CoA dehydrogenase/enoyl-CoA hydratase/3-hydroxybutyryl-CoA epimerase/enoyl-CoA isomerase
MMLPMCTELARCLEEGIVGSAAEADLALLYGIGFPPFRGGVFRWMDTVGMQRISPSSPRSSPPGQGLRTDRRHARHARRRRNLLLSADWEI